MDELELSIKHMLLRVISKWRFVLVCMLCGMLLFGAVGAYMGTRTNDADANEQAQSEESYSEKLAKMREGLTEFEARAAENAADYYLMLKKQVNYWMDYKENSIVAKLDFEHVPTMQMMYYVKLDDKEGSRNKDILQAYLMEIYSGETYKAILDEMGWDIDPEYARELIIAVVDSNGTIKIDVIAENLEDCASIGEVIQKRIQGLEGQMKAVYGPFELSALEENFTVCESEEVAKLQTDRMKNVNTYVEDMEDAGDELKGDQRFYYDMLIDVPEEQDTTAEEPVEEPAPKAEDSGRSILNVKYIVLGAILGVMAGIGIVVLQYMFTARLRRKEDLETVYGAPNLGVIRGKQIDATTIEMICVGIKAMCAKKGIRKLCLTGTYSSEMSEQVKEQICSALSDELEEICYAGSMVTDPKSLEKVTEVDAVVIVEKEDASISAEISRQIDLCKMHDVAIIGSVVLY